MAEPLYGHAINPQTMAQKEKVILWTHPSLAPSWVQMSENVNHRGEGQETAELLPVNLLANPGAIYL